MNIPPLTNPSQAIAQQLTHLSRLLEKADGLTLREIRERWPNNPGTTAVLNRLHRLQAEGLLAVETRINAPKIYKWRRVNVAK